MLHFRGATEKADAIRGMFV